MPGNWHVSFLGGWAGVILSGYPVRRVTGAFTRKPEFDMRRFGKRMS
jgi:hypothetical protein